jgi:putative membrane-bound dehydrogenase-like protein
MNALLLGCILWAQDSTPRSPAEQQAGFSLPEGFRIELVTSEPEVKKLVDIAFDDAGRLWATTALEYPRDANEDPTAAGLYSGGGRDEVLVFERAAPGERPRPRVFAEGLAMPMSVLPLAAGAGGAGDRAIVQHGTEILLFTDSDRDGRADRREVLLSGFGVQDSHLLPHRFTRGPDGWIYTAQGAFNNSQVQDRSGTVTRFEQCKLARFTPDGLHFEVVSAGLNNIWGIVFDERGRWAIQEANDLGYCAVPFERFASYPGIGMDRIRPYSPWEPPPADFRMGGTGLSGLALNESAGGFPSPWREHLIVANPITRVVQSVRLERGAGGSAAVRAVQGAQLISSSDERFRPIAVHFGPDECLYVVDWYNPVISHNEVPRTDPSRDRVRTRLWRVSHASQARFEPFDATRAAPAELLAKLEGPRLWEARAAWHQLVDRRLFEAEPALWRLAADPARPIAARMLALWSLQGLGRFDSTRARVLIEEADPDLARDSVRALAACGEGAARLALLLEKLHTLLEARRECLRALDDLPLLPEGALKALLEHTPAPPDGPVVRCEQGDVNAFTGEAHARAFERFLLRKCLEGNEDGLRRLSSTDAALTPEGLALAALALGDGEAAERLAQALPRLARAPAPEELALLARHAARPTVGSEVGRRLAGRDGRAVLEALLSEPAAQLAPPLRTAVVARLTGLADPLLSARAAEHWQLLELGDLLAETLASATSARESKLAALRALQRNKDVRRELLVSLARRSVPGDEAHGAALHSLAAAGRDDCALAAIELASDAPPLARAAVVQALATSKAGARTLLAALESRRLPLESLDSRARESLVATLAGEEAALTRLRSLSGSSTRVLRLSGGGDDYVDSNLVLDGEFTVECWFQLDEGISNHDGLLGLPGVFDWNFSDARLRLWQGPGDGDVVIARRRVEPGRWTHAALTRDAGGVVRLYLDGELDAQSKPLPPRRFDELDLGRTTPGGTTARLSEVRIWSTCRDALEIATDRLRSFGAERPAGLEVVFPGDALPLHGAARLEECWDFPRLLDRAQWQAEKDRLARYVALGRGGAPERGAKVFERACQVCHSLGGRGESVGPPLDGVGTRGAESLVATILRPSAAIEAGYRLLSVELTDESLLQGLLFAQDDASITLREATATGARPPRRIERPEIARMRWSNLSLMPEGLLQSLADQDAADLLAFLAGQR